MSSDRGGGELDENDVLFEQHGSNHDDDDTDDDNDGLITIQIERFG